MYVSLNYLTELQNPICHSCIQRGRKTRNASKIYLAHFSSMEHPYQSATVSKTLVLLSTSLFLLPYILQKLL